MEVIDVDYVEVPNDPIEEQPPAQKRHHSIAVPVLAAALVVVLVVCGILACKLSAACADVAERNATISAHEKSIASYTATIGHLKEYLAYCQEELRYHDLPFIYESVKARHDARIYDNPFLRPHTP